MVKMEAEVGQYLSAFCIGGIKPENLDQVMEAGVRRCVIVSSLLMAEDIETATRGLKQKITSSVNVAESG